MKVDITTNTSVQHKAPKSTGAKVWVAHHSWMTSTDRLAPVLWARVSKVRRTHRQQPKTTLKGPHNRNFFEIHFNA